MSPLKINKDSWASTTLVQRTALIGDHKERHGRGETAISGKEVMGKALKGDKQVLKEKQQVHTCHMCEGFT